MPNALAYLVLFSWPVVVVVLFWKLPLPRALVASILGGYLLVPHGVMIDLPVLPPINKDLLPGLTAAIMCMVMARKSAVPENRAVRRIPAPTIPPTGPPTGPAAATAPTATTPDSPRRRGAAPWTPPAGPAPLSEPTPGPVMQRTARGKMLFRVLFAVLFATPVMTVLQNPDPVITGPLYIPGLKPYDVGSMILQIGVTFLPFFLAQRYLARPEEQVMLLRALVIAALAYSALCLYEIRMSPQLNNMLYGYYAHDFLQHIRAGGFRPMVFLQHGLLIGIYLAMAVVAAVTLFLWSRRNGRTGLSVFGWVVAAIWLLLVLFMSKAVGAFALVLLFVPVMLLAGVQGQLLFAMIIAGITLFYPLLRGAGWIPVDTVYAVAQSISQERADSLKFRLDNEDLLLARAAEKPLAGWGSWGRNLLYSEYDGRQTTVPDGAWIIIIGSLGWVGYLSYFGLLTAPLFLLGMGRRRLGLTVESAGLALVLAINLLDLIPNASLTPLTYLIAGALCGRYALAPAGRPEGRPEMGADAARSPGPGDLRGPKPGRSGGWPAGPRPQPAAIPVRGRAGEGQITAATPEDQRKYRQPRRRPE